jgi:beta-glucosidase
MEASPRTQLLFALTLFAGAIIAVGAMALRDRFADRLPPIGARYPDSSLPIEERVEDLLSYMTLEEKIGQMTLVEKNSITPTDVERYGVGAVLSGAGGNPEDNSHEGWHAMTGGYERAASRTRLAIPILYGADANHGQGNLAGATLFPHAIGISAANDVLLAEEVGEVTAQESHAVGISWLFSPSLDLPRDIRWGRVYETFGDDPARAARMGAAFARGVIATGVLPTAKHYIGTGSMTWGSSSSDTPAYRIDQGDTPEDEAALRREYLPPFKEAIDAGALSVMAGLNSWGGGKISASSYLLTDILKGELGFKGFVVSDWYGVYEIAEETHEAAARGINAGIDMVMLPYDYDLFAREVRRAVDHGDIPMARIDDAVRRILYVKFKLGLFDRHAGPHLEDIGTPAHRALARTAVQRSLVLLKNEGALPIATSTRLIRVAGSAADNTGRQSGGWTIQWQGVDGNMVPGATSILEGIRREAGGAFVEYERDGSFSSGELADIGIAVVGEKPYAEGWGDSALPVLEAEDLKAIANVRASAKKLVVVIIAGRPLIITEHIDAWDALVMAWLPGSEGEGVADVLFGRVPFSGTLPIHWPASIAQLPIIASTTANGAAPLFPRDFGLK